jgi:hypothetical protein
MELESRVKLVEDAILLMKDLLVSYNGRLDDYQKDFRESREDFNFKLNALIDAQIKNETEIGDLKQSTSELKDSTAKLEESIKQLREISRSQLTRIEKLEDN